MHPGATAESSEQDGTNRHEEGKSQGTKHSMSHSDPMVERSVSEGDTRPYVALI